MITSEKNAPLAGFAIGLSGAVPERNVWAEQALDRADLEFVSMFSALVLQYGGRIVHGTHPTFAPVIVRQAFRHAHSQTDKPVTLVTSELWAKTLDTDDAARYQEVAELLVVKQVGEGGPEHLETRNTSLALMRTHLLQWMNTLVAVGGKLHEQDGKMPGVLEEVKLATQRGIATFLIGGMGGMTARLVQDRAQELQLHNGLTAEQNAQLQTTQDIASCVSTVLNHLIAHHELAERQLSQLDVNDQDCVPYALYRQRGISPD
jgi:hypothetical protein